MVFLGFGGGIENVFQCSYFLMLDTPFLGREPGEDSSGAQNPADSESVDYDEELKQMQASNLHFLKGKNSGEIWNQFVNKFEMGLVAFSIATHIMQPEWTEIIEWVGFNREKPDDIIWASFMTDCWVSQLNQKFS